MANRNSERHSYFYDRSVTSWKPVAPDAAIPESGDDEASIVTVSTYSITAESLQLPSQQQHPSSLLVKRLLADDATSDILVLHGVTDDLLAYLLKQQAMQDIFPYSSHGIPAQEELDPNSRHCFTVVLSKYAFSLERIPFLPLHNTSFVARFTGLGEYANDDSFVEGGRDANFRPLTLLAIQLASCYGEQDLAIEDIAAIVKSLHTDGPMIVAADFSAWSLLNDVSGQDAVGSLSAVEACFNGVFLDVWILHRLEKGLVQGINADPVPEHELGATYHPSAHSKSSSNTQDRRLDRILVRSRDSTTCHVLSVNTFDFIPEQSKDENGLPLDASYRSGVRASLRLGPDPYGRPSSGPGDVVKHLREAPTPLKNPTEVTDLLHSFAPSGDEIAHRAAVHNLVEDFIRALLPSGAATDSTGQGAPLGGLMSVGSYGLGTWTASSDLNLLCIGSISTTTFRSLVKEQLQQTTSGHRITLHKSGNKDKLRLGVNGIRVELQYARADHLATNWPQCLKLPASHEAWSGSKDTVSRLRPLLDMDYIKRSVPDLSNFQLAHRLIRQWAESRGLYGYEYLSSMHITILLAIVYKAWALQSVALSVPDVLVTFFRYYAKFDWTKHAASDSFFHKGKSFDAAGNRGAAFIIGYYGIQDPKYLNTAANTTPSSLRTLTDEFKRADRLLSEQQTSWAQFFLQADGPADFLRSFKTYIKLDVSFWGRSATNGKRYVVSTGEALTGLLRDLRVRLPALHVRRWPGRWINAAAKAQSAREEEEEEEEDCYYHGCYVLGLYQPATEMSKQDDKDMYTALATILTRFQDQIRRNSSSDAFNPQSCYFATAIVKPIDVQGLQHDTRNWSMFLAEEDNDEDDDEATAYSSRLRHLEPRPPSATTTTTTNQPRSVVVPKRDGAGKFRTAADVLHRLLWDPKMDSADFIVGYEDRFVGAMEKGVDAWKLELTHDEFIPQHRILYFKRKSDGTVVWERRTRTDLVFESG